MIFTSSLSIDTLDIDFGEQTIPADFSGVVIRDEAPSSSSCWLLARIALLGELEWFARNLGCKVESAAVSICSFVISRKESVFVRLFVGLFSTATGFADARDFEAFAFCALAGLVSASNELSRGLERRRVEFDLVAWAIIGIPANPEEL